MQTEQVKGIPYVQDLEPRTLERIRTAMFEVQAGKGQLLFGEGNRPRPGTAFAPAR